MKTKFVVPTLGLLLVGAVVSFAGDAVMGTWKLNEAKSKLNPAGPKNHTVVYVVSGDSIKCTVDGTGPDGRAIHSEWTGKFDGKDYAVSGDATSDMRAYKKVDDNTLEMTAKKGNAMVLSGRIVVSADGKTRTVTIDATDPKGAKMTSTAVYDKQ